MPERFEALWPMRQGLGRRGAWVRALFGCWVYTAFDHSDAPRLMRLLHRYARYGVAAISRLLQIIGLFYKTAL